MTRSPAANSGTPSQRTLSAERPLSATDARKADTYFDGHTLRYTATREPVRYEPLFTNIAPPIDLYAFARAERRQHQRINWTLLAVALVCVFLLGMAAVAVPAMVMAGFGL
jgi:hypothetical protein